MIKVWEDARLANKLTDAQREQLKNLDQEHHLFINEKGEYELVAINEITPPEKKDLFRAYAFRRANDAAHTYVLIWATDKNVELMLPIAPDRVPAMRPFGQPVELNGRDGKSKLTVGERMYLAFEGTDLGTVEKLLRKAK